MSYGANFSKISGDNSNNERVWISTDLNPDAPPLAYQNDEQQNPKSQMKSLKEQKFLEILNKYEISQLFSEKLQQLSSFKISFIFDDSGSMNSEY
jgi:hypothetical protein